MAAKALPNRMPDRMKSALAPATNVPMLPEDQGREGQRDPCRHPSHLPFPAEARECKGAAEAFSGSVSRDRREAPADGVRAAYRAPTAQLERR